MSGFFVKFELLHNPKDAVNFDFLCFSDVSQAAITSKQDRAGTFFRDNKGESIMD